MELTKDLSGEKRLNFSPLSWWVFPEFMQDQTQLKEDCHAQGQIFPALSLIRSLINHYFCSQFYSCWNYSQISLLFTHSKASDTSQQTWKMLIKSSWSSQLIRLAKMISVPIVALARILSVTQTARLSFIVSIKNDLNYMPQFFSSHFIVITYYLIITRNAFTYGFSSPTIVFATEERNKILFHLALKLVYL